MTTTPLPITTFTLVSDAAAGAFSQAHLWHKPAIEAALFDLKLDAPVTDPAVPAPITVRGFSDVQNKELTVRVRSALETVGASDVARAGARIVPIYKGMAYQLSPGRYMSAVLDLPIAMAMLKLHDLPGVAAAGELGLDGSLRPVRGIFAFAEAARLAGMRGVIVPYHNVQEALSSVPAEAADTFHVYGLRHLGDRETRYTGAEFGAPRALLPDRDFSAIRGNAAAVASLIDAVASGSDAVLTGPPGVGKTMLAARVPTILKPLTRDQEDLVIKIYSALGAGVPRGQHPFRAPHHTISSAALSGTDRPGEVHLAAHGVLLLDEVEEFTIAALAGLREALASMGSARPMVIVTSNVDSPGRMARVDRAIATLGLKIDDSANISGDRLGRGNAAHIEVSPTTIYEMRNAEPGESSQSIRDRLWGQGARS